MNIIRNEESDYILDKKINDYLKELRKNEDKTEEILKKEINNFNYKYYKIDNEIRKYIQAMLNEYTETIGQIKSEYI